MTDDSPLPLKLRAEDADDLEVISACLQDALVAVVDLAYVSEDRAFMLVANRFRWERGNTAPDDPTAFERVLCGIAFSEVDGVSYRGFRRGEVTRILSLLAIRLDSGIDSAIIHVDFAAGASIRLEAARIRCLASDLGEPWPTSWQPDHPAGEPA